MCDNWPEIIEIMKTVISHDRSRTELKIAIGSTLRTLGWRATTGSMQTDFILKSGQKIDAVLGESHPNGIFRPVLPIYAGYDQPKGGDWSDFITEIMSDINVRIAIVAGTSFELFFMDEVSHKAVRVGKASFILGDKTGEKLSSLLSVSDFNEANLIGFFDSLYKENLPIMKLNAIIRSIANDKSKSKDILKQYLKNEGFEESIIEEALCNVDVNIFFKTPNHSESKLKHDRIDTPLNNIGHDNTRFSLNGGPFLTKRQFVLSVVSQYIKDNPSVTLNDLEARFPSAIASKVRGIVRAWSQVKLWAEENGPDIIGRYCSKENERITLHDGTEIVVNSQWGSKNFPRFLALAKQLYSVGSNAPYESAEHVETTDNTIGNRAKNFKFSMAGINIGEMIVFDATNTKVKVVSDDSIEYNGKKYRLSAFVRTYIPQNMRTPSDSYRGPDFFSYKGKTLTRLRNDAGEKKMQVQHSEEKINKGIQISLSSFNTFKTHK